MSRKNDIEYIMTAQPVDAKWQDDVRQMLGTLNATELRDCRAAIEYAGASATRITNIPKTRRAFRVKVRALIALLPPPPKPAPQPKKQASNESPAA